MTRVEIAPAKINLGLEILGRRDDGFHEVRTILAAISLHDTLTFETHGGEVDVIETDPPASQVAGEANLVKRSLDEMRGGGAQIPAQRVTLSKRIPAAAGLGGASSDAAAALRAFASELRTAGAEPFDIAERLGSDVPFFLDGPVALASGRGEVLTPLAAPEPAWVVLALPELVIPDKTRTMYRAVHPVWWSDGARIAAIADRLPQVPRSAPFNVFEAALTALYPDLGQWGEHLVQAGFSFVAVTGAGPTHYTLVPSESAARDIAARLDTLGIRAIVAQLGSPGRHGR